MAGRRNPILVDDLALAVATGKSLAEWAREHRVPERTAYGWNASPGFKEKVAEHRRRIVDGIVGQLVGQASESVGRIAELAKTAPNPATRLAADRTLLSYLMDVSHFAAIEQRLAELERRFDESERDHDADPEA